MLREFRDRFHPLHRARTNKVLSSAVLPRIDLTVRVRLADVDWPVYVRLVRHLSHIVNSRMVESGPKSLFAVLIDQLSPTCFWDVGANFGIYSWLFLTRVPRGTVLAVEPEPDNLTLLRRTIAHADLRGITCLSVAASDQSGQATFNRDPMTGATGGLRGDTEPYIRRHYNQQAPTMTVETATLDELASKHPLPDLVKIDVEGAELSVLDGARELLREHQPVVLFEAQEHHRDEAITVMSETGYLIQSSLAPDRGINSVVDESISAAGDLVALPTRFHDMWPEIRADWAERLRQQRRKAWPARLRSR